MRDGNPIQNRRLKDQLNAGITYSSSFEEYRACVHSGMDYGKWEALEDNYSVETKARAIVGYRMDKLIEANVQDAQNAAQRKAGRKKK
jgi:hypothetical protein